MDISNINQQLEENGYVIVPNVYNKEEISQYKEFFYDWYFNTPYLEEFHYYMSFGGIFKFHNVGHQRFAWLARINEKIINIFKHIWNTDQLIVSFDGCCYYPNNYDKEQTYWTHSDQSSMKKGKHCIQSFLSLTENKERTLIVYEKSHKLHESYFEQYNICNNKDWNIIKEEYIETIQHTKKILHVKAGDLVLWDSRLFHQNSSGSNDCTEERLVQYLCYLPRNHEKNDEENQEKRLVCYEEKYTTSHWPCPISPIPKQHIHYSEYGNDIFYIDYTEIHEASLDDIQDKINRLI